MTLSDQRISTVLLKIAGRETRRRCKGELAHLAAMKEKMQAWYYETLLANLVRWPDTDQIALSVALAKIAVVDAALPRDERAILPAIEMLGEEDPEVSELRKCMLALGPAMREAATAYTTAGGCAGALPERGRRLAVRLDTAMRAYQRAKAALLAKTRALRQD